MDEAPLDDGVPFSGKIEMMLKQFFLHEQWKEFQGLNRPRFDDFVTNFLFLCKTPDDEYSILSRWLLFISKSLNANFYLETDEILEATKNALNLIEEVKSACAIYYPTFDAVANKLTNIRIYIEELENILSHDEFTKPANDKAKNVENVRICIKSSVISFLSKIFQYFPMAVLEELANDRYVEWQPTSQSQINCLKFTNDACKCFSMSTSSGTQKQSRDNKENDLHKSLISFICDAENEIGGSSASTVQWIDDGKNKKDVREEDEDSTDDQLSDDGINDKCFNNKKYYLKKAAAKQENKKCGESATNKGSNNINRDQINKNDKNINHSDDANSSMSPVLVLDVPNVKPFNRFHYKKLKLVDKQVADPKSYCDNECLAEKNANKSGVCGEIKVVVHDIMLDGDCRAMRNTSSNTVPSQPVASCEAESSESDFLTQNTQNCVQHSSSPVLLTGHQIIPSRISKFKSPEGSPSSSQSQDVEPASSSVESPRKKAYLMRCKSKKCTTDVPSSSSNYKQPCSSSTPIKVKQPQISQNSPQKMISQKTLKAPNDKKIKTHQHINEYGKYKNLISIEEETNENDENDDNDNQINKQKQVQTKIPQFRNHHETDESESEGDVSYNKNNNQIPKTDEVLNAVVSKNKMKLFTQTPLTPSGLKSATQMDDHNENENACIKAKNDEIDNKSQMGYKDSTSSSFSAVNKLFHFKKRKFIKYDDEKDQTTKLSRPTSFDFQKKDCITSKEKKSYDSDGSVESDEVIQPGHKNMAKIKENDGNSSGDDNDNNNMNLRRKQAYYSSSDESFSFGDVSPDRPRGKKRKKWTTEEELILYKAVKTHGVSRWAAIKSSGVLKGRSNVDIKDKWRQMTSSGRDKELQRMIMNVLKQ